MQKPAFEAWAKGLQRMLLIVVVFGVGQVLYVSINAIWSPFLDSESSTGASCDPTKIGGILLIAGEREAPAVDFRTEVDINQATRAFRSPRAGWGQVCGRFTGRLLVKKSFRYPVSTARQDGITIPLPPNLTSSRWFEYFCHTGRRAASLEGNCRPWC